MLFAVAKLEFLADLISQPVLAGFLSGVGVSLIIGNLSGMLGVPASGSTWDKLTQTLSELDQANWTTAALAFGTVIVMLVLEEKMPKIPAALVSLTLFSVVAVVIDASASGVESVGAIPAGLPGLHRPGLPDRGVRHPGGQRVLDRGGDPGPERGRGAQLRPEERLPRQRQGRPGRALGSEPGQCVHLRVRDQRLPATHRRRGLRRAARARWSTSPWPSPSPWSCCS